MKNLKPDLVELLKTRYCAPTITALARKLRQPSPTIFYNIKQMEKDGTIRTYKAVFDYKKINEGFCSYVLLKFNASEYPEAEKMCTELVKFPQVESLDVVSGTYDVVLKIRTKDIDEFYQFIKNALSQKVIRETTSLNSLSQLKTEFVEVH